MESPLKTAVRPGGAGTPDVSDLRAVLSQPEGEMTVGSGLPLDEDLERLARTMGERGISDILGSWPEERSERILALFENMTAAVAQLSDELCKEDHGRFMKLATLIESLAGRIDAQLIALKRDVEGQTVVAPGLVMRFVAAFSPRIRRLVSQMESQRVRRTLTLQTVREYRELSDRLRKRPKEIHEAAVQHVKRILLAQDERFQAADGAIRALGKDIEDARTRHYWEKREDLLEKLRLVESQKERINQELYDRALQQVQESDNGPRQK